MKKKVIEEIVDPELIRVEDSGQAKMYVFGTEVETNEGDGLFLEMSSWDQSNCRNSCQWIGNTLSRRL